MASANLYQPMTWIEKLVLADQSFILDSVISIRLKLSQVTRCIRAMAQKNYRGSSKSVLVRFGAHRSVPGSGMNPAALATRETSSCSPALRKTPQNTPRLPPRTSKGMPFGIRTPLSWKASCAASSRPPSAAPWFAIFSPVARVAHRSPATPGRWVVDSRSERRCLSDAF
jgi:hypothetical protein